MILTINGLYQYDKTIFRGLHPPAGINKDVLTATILMQSDGRSSRYADPNVFAELLSLFSVRKSRIWEKMYYSTTLEYNPIENYDRYEDTTVKGDNVRTNNVTDSRSTESNSQSEDTSSSTSASNSTSTSTSTSTGTSRTVDDRIDNTRNSVSAFDSESPSLHDTQNFESGNTTEGDTRNTTSDIGRGDASQQMSGSNRNHASGTSAEHGAKNEQGAEDLKTETVSHIHGNIGVTTADQMLKGYRDGQSFDIYEYIANDIVNEFCLLCY